MENFPPNFCHTHSKKFEFFCKATSCGAILCNGCRKAHQCSKNKLTSLDEFLLDNYEFIKYLGEGSFGTVFGVKSLWNGKEYALKVIYNVDQNNIENVQKEIKLMCSLRHENIVRFSHCVYNRSLQIFWIAMELCESSLSDLIPNLNKKTAVNLFTQICNGVSFLHCQQNILHRDLKPANILVKDGIVKLCDFGQGKKIPENKTKITKTNDFGTPEYLAPEILGFMKEDTQVSHYTKKAEIWALGILFHEMLTKDVHPFLKDVSYKNEFRLSIIQNIIVSNEPRIDPSIKDKKLRGIIQKCLEKLPENRPDINDLIEMLGSEERQLPIKKQMINYEEMKSIKGHSDTIKVIQLSDDETKILSGSWDNSAILWDSFLAEKLQTFILKSSIYGVIFSKRDPSKIFIGSKNEGISEWDIKSGKIVQKFENDEEEILRSLNISPDGMTLVSGMSENVNLWNSLTGEVIKVLKGHSSWVDSVCFSPDATIIASGSEDKTIKLWKASSGKLLRTLMGHSRYVYTVVFSPDGEKLASGSHDKSIKIWDVSTGDLLLSIEVFSLVCCLCFHPQGKYLISGDSESKVKVWRVGTGNLVQILTSHQDNVKSLAVSKDGSSIVSASKDGKIKIWNLVE